jgi:predicted SnoaL-like aldol condensation-catalyzing enzyme
MAESKEARNKALVLKAFDTLFNKRDYATAERLWSPNYIQHTAHTEPCRAGFMNLSKSLPPTLKYEPGMLRGRAVTQKFVASRDRSVSSDTRT